MINNSGESCGLIKDRERIGENQFLFSALHISFLLWFPVDLQIPEADLTEWKGSGTRQHLDVPDLNTALRPASKAALHKSTILNVPSNSETWTIPNFDSHHEPSLWTVSFFQEIKRGKSDN